MQIWKNTCVGKVLNVVQLLVQSDGENLLARMIEITAIYVWIYDNFFLVYLICEEDLISWKVTECNFFYSHICSLGWTWMNKFLFTENNLLPRLIKQESCRSSHCIFQIVYALNTRSIKLLRRSVVKVLIMLLIKQ